MKKNKNRKHLYIAIILNILFSIPSISSAQDCPPQITNDTIDFRSQALASILPNYNDWESVELNGKLYMEKLPLNPSVRIYMQRNNEISISVRAPFIGEVGRIQIAGDSILAVNKMKHVFCLESLQGIQYDYPDIIGELQSLLLSRAVIFQDGELSYQNAEFVDIFPLQDDTAQEYTNGWTLTFPKGRTDIDDFGYTYRLGPEGFVNNLSVALQSADVALAMDFTYQSSKTDLSVTAFKDDTPKFSIRLALDYPKWNANPMSPIKISSRYKRVGIGDFIHSF